MELLNLRPEEVRQLHTAGQLDDEQVADYLVLKKRQEFGIHALTPDEVKRGNNRDLFSTPEIENYIERKRNPISYALKDIGAGIYHGLHNFGRNAAEAYDSVTSWMATDAALDREGGNLPEEATNLGLAAGAADAARGVFDIDRPDTGWGTFTEDVTEFAANTWAAGKVLKGLTAIPQFVKLAESGKKGKLVAGFIEHNLKYYAGEQMTFDSHEARFSNLLTEVPGFGIVAEYLKAEEDDTDLQGRLKMFVESGLIDLGVAGLGKLLRPAIKALKAKIWEKAGWKSDEAAALTDDLVHGEGHETALVSEANRPLPTASQEAKPTVQTTQAVTTTDERLRSAYHDLVDETGFRNVQISDLIKKSGLTKQEVHDIILKEGKAGNAAPALGDASVSPKEVVDAGITLKHSKDPHLLVKFDNWAEEGRPKPKAQAEARPDTSPTAKKESVPSSTPASQLKASSQVNDVTYGRILEMVENNDAGLTGEMLSIHAERGFDTFQDWMNPLNLFGRLKAKFMKAGMTDKEAKANAAPLIQQYERKYKAVVESIKSGETKAGPTQTEASRGFAGKHQPGETHPGGKPEIKSGQMPNAPSGKVEGSSGEAWTARKPVYALKPDEEAELADRLLRAVKGWDEVDIDEGILVNFEKLETVDDVKRLMNTMADIMTESEDIKRYTRGKVPFAKTEATEEALTQSMRETAAKLADKTGTPPQHIFDLFMRKQVGEDWRALHKLDAKMRAYDRFLIAYDEMIVKMAKEAKTPEDFVKIQSHMQFLYEIQALSKGITTETARALSSRRMMRSAMWRQITPQMMEEVTEAQGETLRKIVESYAKEPKRSIRMKIVRGAGRSKWENMGRWLVEYRQSALVSNPMSQIRNVVGNSLALASEGTARLMAGAGMSIRHGDAQYFRQALAYFKGAAEGFIEAVKLPGALAHSFREGKFKEAWDTIKAELAKDPFKQDNELGRMWRTLFTGETVTDYTLKFGDQVGFRSVLEETKLGRFPLGKVLTVPFKMLSAADEFFKGMSFHGEKHFLAYGEALEKFRAAGGKAPTESLMFDYARLVSEPSQALMEKAIKHSRDVTFTQELGKVSRPINAALNAAWPAKLMFVPFFSVATNIAKFAAYRMVPSMNWMKAWNAGGMQRFIAVSQLGLGWSAMAAATGLYLNGRITGAAPPDQKNAWRNAGVQEYSLRVGDEWVNFSAIEPFGSILGITCDLARLSEDVYVNDREFNERFSMIMSVLADNFGNKTFMQGFGDFTKLFNDPEMMNSEKFLQRFVSTMAPYSTALQQIQRSTDEYVRDFKRWQDAIWVNVREGKMLTRRHAVYGHSLARVGNTALIFKTSETTDDPALADMVKCGANIGAPSRNWRFAGQEIKLEPEEYDQYMAIIEELSNGSNGQNGMRAVLNSLALNSNFQTINDDQTKAEVYKKIVSDYRNAARAIWMSRNMGRIYDVLPELQARAEAIAGRGYRPNEDTQLYHWARK